MKRVYRADRLACSGLRSNPLIRFGNWSASVVWPTKKRADFKDFCFLKELRLAVIRLVGTEVFSKWVVIGCSGNGFATGHGWWCGVYGFKIKRTVTIILFTSVFLICSKSLRNSYDLVKHSRSNSIYRIDIHIRCCWARLFIHHPRLKIYMKSNEILILPIYPTGIKSNSVHWRQIAYSNLL